MIDNITSLAQAVAQEAILNWNRHPFIPYGYDYSYCENPD